MQRGGKKDKYRHASPISRCLEGGCRPPSRGMHSSIKSARVNNSVSTPLLPRTAQPTIQKESVEEGGHTRDLILNADETALYWKMVPSSTYKGPRTKDEGQRRQKMSIVINPSRPASPFSLAAVLHVSAKSSSYFTRYKIHVLTGTIN